MYLIYVQGITEHQSLFLEIQIIQLQ